VANAKKKKQSFNVKTFLSTVGDGRTISNYRKNDKVFSQGDPADSVFYVQAGKVKVCVISELGKEAVVALHGKGNFFGEGCLNGQPLRLATVTAMTDCVIMRLDKASIVKVLPKRSWRTCWLGTPASRKIWSINFSIRAKSVWRVCSY
jgi:CRP/FNR family transcriptional regulator, cyclic AMP receptor protein